MHAARRGAVAAGQYATRYPEDAPGVPVEPNPTVPDAPVLQGAAGDTQNVLQWTEPDDGGRAISTYTLERVADATLAVGSAVTGNSSNSTTCTVSGTGAGSDRLLVVAVSHRDDTALRTISSVTFNGDPLAVVPSAAESRAAAFMGAELWYMVAPDVATGNIVVTMSAACDIDVTGIFFTGAHQSSPFGTPAVTNELTANPSLAVSSAVGEIVVDCLAGVTSGAITVGSGQTQRANQATATSGQIVRQGVSTEAGAASVTMSWTRDADHFAYVAVPVKPASASAEIYNALAPRSYTDTGRTNGIENDYRVKATNSVGDSAWSNTVSLTPAAVPPPITVPAKASLTGTAGDRTVNMFASTTSDGNSPIISWEFQQDLATVQNTPQSIYSTTTLVNDIDYDFRVRAINAVGNGEWSDTLTLRPIAPPATPTVPDAPVLSGTPGNTQNLLSWTVPFDGNDDLSTYELQRATASNFSGAVLILSNTLTTSHTDTGRSNGTTYYYRVRAVNGVGNGEYSNTVALTPSAPASVPDPPVLSGSAGNGSVSMTWTQPFSGGSAITTYELYAGFTLKQNVLSPRSFSESGLPNDVEQTWWVRAKNAIGYSEPSNRVPLTPTSPSGAPSLPANTVVGRPASGLAFWGGVEVGLFPTPAEVAGWQTNIGFNRFYTRIASGSWLTGYGAGQRLTPNDATQAPYASDSSYDWQRIYQTTGPFQAKRNGAPIEPGFYIKFHKPRDNSYTSPGVGGDLGPFGGDWWDDSHWADVCAKAKTFFQGAKYLGANHFIFDPEFGTWDYPPTGGRTLAQQKVIIEQRGYEMGKAIMEAHPDAQLSHYGLAMLGSWHEEVVLKNEDSSDGCYFHTPGPAFEDNASRFAGEYPPAPITATHGYHQDQGYQGWQHLNFFRGMWRAMALFADTATWTYQDAFWYHGNTQYNLTGISDTQAHAMRWGLFGLFSWLSRDPQLSQTTKNWLCRNFYWTGCTWAATDSGNGYWSTQLREPDYSNLLKKLRTYGMNGFKAEYGNGMATPSSITGNAAGNGTGSSRYSAGRPLLISYGYNLYTGATGGGTTSTGTLGLNPTCVGSTPGCGSPGQVITYGPTAATPTTPVDWTGRYPVPASRRTNMLASCSTAPIASSVPTLSNVSAVRQGNGSVVVTCRARHASHAIQYVSIHRGSTFDKLNPNGSLLGCAAMTFEPNNGTNLPPAGFSLDSNGTGVVGPYQQCTFTTSTGFSIGQYLVIRVRSTKEDDLWQNVQIT